MDESGFTAHSTDGDVDDASAAATMAATMTPTTAPPAAVGGSGAAAAATTAATAAPFAMLWLPPQPSPLVPDAATATTTTVAAAVDPPPQAAPQLPHPPPPLPATYMHTGTPTNALTQQQQQEMMHYHNMFNAYLQANAVAAAAVATAGSTIPVNDATTTAGGAAAAAAAAATAVAMDGSSYMGVEGGAAAAGATGDSAATTATAARLTPHTQPTFVNAKQYGRIMKRRETRHALEMYFQRVNASKPTNRAHRPHEGGPSSKKGNYQHESRHKHAMKRPRGKHGRFLTGHELEEYYREHPDEDPKNPANAAAARGESDHDSPTNKQATTSTATTGAATSAAARSSATATKVKRPEDAVPLLAAAARAAVMAAAAGQYDDDAATATLPVSPIVLPGSVTQGGDGSSHSLLDASRPSRIHYDPRAATATTGASNVDAGVVDPLLSEAAEALTGVADDENDDTGEPSAKKQRTDFQF